MILTICMQNSYLLTRWKELIQVLVFCLKIIYNFSDQMCEIMHRFALTLSPHQVLPAADRQAVLIHCALVPQPMVHSYLFSIALFFKKYRCSILAFNSLQPSAYLWRQSILAESHMGR